MCLFPCIVSDEYGQRRGVTFRTITTQQMPGVQYVALPDGGRRPGHVSCYLDQRLSSDHDTYATVLSAIAFCGHNISRPIFISTDARAGESIEGASLGLALCVEICYPACFPATAFTGYLGLMSEDDQTAFVMPVNGIREKILGALQQGVPIVVPSSPTTNYPPTRFLSGTNFTSYFSPTGLRNNRAQFRRPGVAIATTFAEAVQFASWIS